MRTTTFLVLAGLCALSSGHAGDAKPDAARLKRHAQKLSEACKRKGRTMDTCPLDPETTEGPYSWEDAPIREDITEDYPGVPFEFTVQVVNSNTCEDVEGAGVQVWHCNAAGIYSHYIASSTNTGSETDDSTFLRGLQYTNSTGYAKFLSIFPGWYEGRTTHIHVRVHFGITETEDGGFTGGTIEHTGQLFFDDDVVSTISGVSPYSDNTATLMWLAEDGIYTGYGLFTLSEMYPGEGYSSGVVGTVTVGIDNVPDTTPSPSSSSTPTPATTTTPTPATTTTTPTPASTTPDNGTNGQGGAMGGMGNQGGMGGGPGSSSASTPTPTTTPTPTAAPTPTPVSAPTNNGMNGQSGNTGGMGGSNNQGTMGGSNNQGGTSGGMGGGMGGGH